MSTQTRRDEGKEPVEQEVPRYRKKPTKRRPWRLQCLWVGDWSWWTQYRTRKAAEQAAESLRRKERVQVRVVAPDGRVLTR